MTQPRPDNASADTTESRFLTMGGEQLLRLSLAIVTSMLAAFYVYQLASKGIHLFRPSLSVPAFVSCLIAYLCLRAGRVSMGLTVLIWGLWLTTSALAVLLAGIYTPMLFAFPVFIMLIGWMHGRRQALWMGAMSIVVMLALVFGAEAGWLEAAVRRSPREMLFAIVAVLLLATLLASTLSENDKRQQAKERALKHALQDRLADLQRSEESIRVLNAELEQRVTARTAELSSSLVKLQHAQAELVQAEKLASLGVLVAGIAHELNTPIGNAVTAASTLQEHMSGMQAKITGGELRRSSLVQFFEQGSEITALLERSCERAAHLIASFKQVAVDRTSEHRRHFNLLALVKDIEATLRPGYKNAAWTIVTDISPEIDCDSYPGPLGQIVTNLIQNAALHAFDAASGTLRISATATENDVTLQFTDDGKGMDAATLAHIFDPFFTTRLGQGGSGLGLSICRNIATGTLGGALRAEAEPGRGAQFTLNFPLQAPA